MRIVMSYLKRTQQTLIHAHHGTRVVEFAAVIRSREERDQLPLRKEFIAIFDDLVRATDQIHVVFLQEARDDVRSKGKRNTAIVLAPAGDVLVWIGPEEVAEKTAIGDLLIHFSIEYK